MRDDGLLPVVLAPTAPAPSNATSDANGIVVLELGEIRVRIEGEPNAPTLAQVLDRVLRRSGCPPAPRSGWPPAPPTCAPASMAWLQKCRRRWRKIRSYVTN
jgi:hypothetical protein